MRGTRISSVTWFGLITVPPKRRSAAPRPSPWNPTSPGVIQTRPASGFRNNFPRRVRFGVQFDF